MEIVNFKPKKIMAIHESLLLSLPAAWVQSEGLGKGDLLDVSIADDRSLVIRPIAVAKPIEEEDGKTNQA